MTTAKQQRDLRIVFMGTPEFAVPSLELLIQTQHHIVAVVTATDKPAGRGKKLQESAVKITAIANNLKVLQPENLKAASFITELQELNADLFIVVAFRMLPEIVWKMPKYGTFNLHASLLPQYRGAAPINWALINGETITGITTFFLKHEIDTGAIILQEEVAIATTDNFGTLYDKLKINGASLLLRTVELIANNSVIPLPQENIALEELHHAPKLTKETGLINWGHSAVAIHNLVRGLAPQPCAYTFLNGKLLKLISTEVITEITIPSVITFSNSTFTAITNNKNFLAVCCNNGYLSIKELQLEGKKKMTILEFLNGHPF